MGKVDDLGFDLGEVEEFQTPPPGMKEIEFATYTKGMGPSGSPFFAFEFTIADGPGKGFRLYDNSSTAENARFRLKRILRCLSHPVGAGTIKIEEDVLKGKRCLAETYIDVYVDKDGKEKPKLKINDYFPLEEKAQRMGQEGATSSAQPTQQATADPKLQFND